MASSIDSLADLERMNDELEKVGKRLGQIPNKIVPEPENTLVGESSASTFATPKMPLTYTVEAANAERQQRDLLKNAQITEGEEPDAEEHQIGGQHREDDAYTAPPTDPYSGDSQIEQLNLLSAQEFLSSYSTFVNHLSLEGFEWKNSDIEKELKKERNAKRAFASENNLSAADELILRQRIDEITQMLEKHGEVRDKLAEDTKLSPEKQQQAATLLSEIWKIKGVEVSPYWALALIVCAPLLNAILIIFFDGKRLKLEAQ
jgi:hypothetical protein